MASEIELFSGNTDFLKKPVAVKDECSYKYR
jgi:hypothetical protein